MGAMVGGSLLRSPQSVVRARGTRRATSPAAAWAAHASARLNARQTLLAAAAGNNRASQPIRPPGTKPYALHTYER
jgi:hypothetical protein